MHDLVIRGGIVVDGSGADRRVADVAIDSGTITQVGQVRDRGVEEIDATGRIVTPGFVDIHTHYDGHAVWGERMAPSSQHGVTTILTGNCGVGFAPCLPNDHERLVALMEGVEDIPEVVLTAGLSWNWESFPDYLDVLDGRAFDMDVATQLPHAPLRLYVMGERAMDKAPATPEDIARMRRIASEAVRAGALGFSSSRSLNHKASDGTVTPSYSAASDELVGIALGLKDAGTGVLQMISDFDDIDGEFAILRRMVGESGRPLSFSMMQMHHVPDRWRGMIERMDQANADGLEIRAQVSGRPVGLMGGLEFSRGPFIQCPTFQRLADLPTQEKLAALRQPDVRAAILAELAEGSPAGSPNIFAQFGLIYELEGSCNYQPDPSHSIAARAAAAGVPAADFAYDLMLDQDGATVLFYPSVNFVGNSSAAMEAMLENPHTFLGLGDGGAHCGMICDASLPTYMLTHWVRSGFWSLEKAVQALTRETAAAVGLNDRGLIAPGMRADLNIIDIERLSLTRPRIHADLPEGGRRLGQDPIGYDATIVAGAITYRAGVATGALPGRLVRGAKSPAAPSDARAA